MQTNLEFTRPEKLYIILAMTLFWEYARRRAYQQLIAENEQLKREIELLKDYIKELEARLAKYENVHTPPSLGRGRIIERIKIAETRENLAESSVMKA